MFHEHQRNPLAEAVLRAQQHWDEQHHLLNKEENAPWTIAISREAGANAPEIAQEVGALLGWPVYDHELLEHIAQDHGLRVQLLESLDEKPESWLRESVEQFASKATMSMPAYVRYLLETMRSLSEHGHCVIVGRGAAQVLPQDKTLRVRLIAPLHDRIHSIADRHGWNKEEAASWVDRTDRERKKFVMDHFHKDLAEPHQYDLMINTGRLSVTESAELIAKGLRAAEAGRRLQAAARA